MRHDPRFYWSAEWRRARAAYLAQRPVCETPGCGARASHVDHRVSRARGGDALAPSNLWALCQSCHSAKTAAADGGFGNPRRKAQERGAKGCGPDGLPLDPGHRWNAPGEPR